jgi:hypothetical protein
MVLGDTVNTASRLQSLAAPGTVLVDDVTRRASEAAIAYEDAGTHDVKGREQPVHTHVALRVVAGVGGQGRAVGLEAPFVGRDRELDLIVEAAERSGRERRAELVLVAGEAGTGKSRIGWEFEKHSDGIAEEVRWHRGRCLSYGEGIAYWALAEMVRARAGIQEEEDADEARAKLRATVETYVSDERERRLVEPRLAHLLGLEQRIAPDRADLFSGWRLFFERMAAADPVILLFEDLHWADSGLLDFLDYLLEWSAEFPIFILALARPEVTEAWPAREPAIRLEPLPDAAMHELLSGLVPGLPDEVEGRIRGRAEGIPLYAVETVRMLLDRGLLALDGSRYVVTGDVGDLEVPETLHALVASRLDSRPVWPRWATARWPMQSASWMGSWPSRCCRSTRTRGRRSAGSTGSSRRCCARSPTGCCPGATGRTATWRRRATCRRRGARTRARSPSCWRPTSSTPLRRIPRPRMRRGSAPSPRRRSRRRGAGRCRSRSAARRSVRSTGRPR